MTNVLAFPRRRRRARAVATPMFPAEVLAFPLVKYAGEVERVARHIRSLQTADERRDAMIAYAERRWAELAARGVEERALENEVIRFASTVWVTVRRDEYGGVA